MHSLNICRCELCGRCNKQSVIKLFIAIAASLAWLFTSASANAAELQVMKRIPLSESLNPDAGVRLMLFTSTFNLLPQKDVEGFSGANPQAPPGTSSGAAALGNLIGMLLVKGINENDQRNTLGFRLRLQEILTKFDIGRELSSAVTDALKQANFKEIAIEDIIEPANLEQPGLLIRIRENSIITLSTQCYFDPKMRNVHVLSSVRVWKKDQSRPMYFTEMRYTSPNLDDLGTADLRNKWTDNNGELLIGNLRQGLLEIGRLLKLDLLRQENSDIASVPVAASWIQPDTGKTVTTPFYVLDEAADRLVGRPYSPQAAMLISIPKVRGQ